MKSFFRNNGLSMVLIGLFLAFWMAQAVVGHLEYNEDREQRQLPALTFDKYLRSSHFWEATGENWESEFLQMAFYVFLTAFLFQKGSSESRDPDKHPENQSSDKSLDARDKPDAPWPVRRGGWILKLYENSLGLTFALLFVASMLVHASAGMRLNNEEQIALGREAVGFIGYFQTSRFWFESFQNWQSEFLAMSAMITLSIVLRQRSSPESKPVAAAMSETGGQD